MWEVGIMPSEVQRRIVYAHEEERQRIARELHDQIIQPLVGLNYELADLHAYGGQDSKERIAQVQQELRHIIDRVRDVCWDLRPPPLGPDGLAGAIRSWTAYIERRSGLKVDLQVLGDRSQSISEDVGICVFRVYQEALINVCKHAATQHVQVVLQLDGDRVSLIVRDGGKGFHVPRQLTDLLVQQHFGLVGMRERLHLVHGTIQIESSAGGGTCVHVRVPC